jgi:hypothetical protein
VLRRTCGLAALQNPCLGANRIAGAGVLFATLPRELRAVVILLAVSIIDARPTWGAFNIAGAGARNHQHRVTLAGPAPYDYRQSAGAHKKMINVDDAAVLMRAKTIAAADSFTWPLDFDAHGARLLRFLSEDRRREYVVRPPDESVKKSALPKAASR